MSKKPPKAEKRAELVEARVVREEDWALEAYRAGVPFPEMRRLALAPVDEGGLGYTLNESALRSLVQSARARHGETTLNRSDRVDRQQAWIDERAGGALHDLRHARAMMQVPPPSRDDFDFPAEYSAALAAHAKMLEAAAKQVESAERRLEVAMDRESKLHGDYAATKIEAEVTTRDGVLDELNASLAALDLPTVEAMP